MIVTNLLKNGYPKNITSSQGEKKNEKKQHNSKSTC